MNRRDAVLALAALGATPFAALAQSQQRVWRIGFLSQRSISLSESDVYYGPFRQGMRELGYVEGKNLSIEWRSAEGKIERLSELAAELVKLNVDVIVTPGTPSSLAARKATSKIPIVIANVANPVGSGLVVSLARPGGNVTGLSNIVSSLGPKQFEFLLTLMPKLSRLAILLNPSNASHAALFDAVQKSVRPTGVRLLRAEARIPKDIESAFTMMTREKAEALIVGQDPFSIQQRRQIADLALANRLPSISGFREYAESGGLLSYGASITDTNRRVAIHVDKILKGASPGEIPVEQPALFEFVINGSTAKALGLTLPQAVLARADEVIL
jgi:putative ABC transport system substrate-binding protein